VPCIRQLIIAVVLVSSSAQASRVLVLPVGGDVDASTSVTLGRAVETAVQAALPNDEIMTPASLQTSMEVSQLRDCTADEAVGACVSELADAANADVVVRPHLGRLGDEMLLTMTLTAGSSARLLAQAQRRVEADRPSGLLDVIPGLVRQTVGDAGLGRTGPRPAPIVPIGVAVGGAVGAGLGVIVLAVRGTVADDYQSGDLDRGSAGAFEVLGGPALLGGGALVVAGTLVALGGAGVAVWSIVGGE
jgi:hypothetical protein